MSIVYEMAAQGDLLAVVASGSDDDLADVLNYGMAVIEEAVKGGCSRILCDETRLEYRLNTIDTFDSARLIAEKAPESSAGGNCVQYAIY